MSLYVERRFYVNSSAARFPKLEGGFKEKFRLYSERSCYVVIGISDGRRSERLQEHSEAVMSSATI
jgi:hypothetical protein